MRVILFKSVDNLGSAGDVVDVKRGYYRNYLGPRGFAREASKSNLALVESQRKKIDDMVRREKAAAGQAAEALKGIELDFELRANDKGQLFGSVTSMDIAKALLEKGSQIDRRKIEMPENIKSLGTYPVKIRLYPEVFAVISIHVKRLLTPEEEENMRAEEERRARMQATGETEESHEDELSDTGDSELDLEPEAAPVAEVEEQEADSAAE